MGNKIIFFKKKEKRKRKRASFKPSTVYCLAKRSYSLSDISNEVGEI